MTANEVCDALKISRKTLYNRVKSGRITPVREKPALDKEPLRFRAEDVERLAHPAASK